MKINKIISNDHKDLTSRHAADKLQKHILQYCCNNFPIRQDYLLPVLLALLIQDALFLAIYLLL